MDGRVCRVGCGESGCGRAQAYTAPPVRRSKVIRATAWGFLAAGVLAPLVRKRLPVPPLVTQSVAFVAPVGLCVAIRRSRARDVAACALQMWAYVAAYKTPHDDLAGQEQRVRIDYPIAIDRALGLGELPTVRLQRAFARVGPDGPEWRALDRVLVWTHWSWFLMPHGALLYILLRRHSRFDRAAVLTYAVFDIGAMFYWVLPTAPPWYAAAAPEDRAPARAGAAEGGGDPAEAIAGGAKLAGGAGGEGEPPETVVHGEQSPQAIEGGEESGVGGEARGARGEEPGVGTNSKVRFAPARVRGVKTKPPRARARMAGESEMTTGPGVRVAHGDVRTEGATSAGGVPPRRALAVRRMMVEYGEYFWEDSWGPLYSVLGGNPLAAMPSLHFATSVMAAQLLAETGPVAGAVGWAYASTLGLALVYLGEHYAVDLLAGAGLTTAIHRLGPHAAPAIRRCGRAVAALEDIAHATA